MSAQAAPPLAVKIVSDGQIRRFVLPGGSSREATAAAYDALRKLLSDNYAKAVAAEYSLTFVDEEGDQCMLTNGDEFREAVRLMAPAANATLKLFLQPKAGSKPVAVAAAAPAPAPAPAAAAAKSTPAPALPPTPVAVAVKPKAATPVAAASPASKPAADKPAAAPAAAKPSSPAVATAAAVKAAASPAAKSKAPAAATAAAATATATAAAPASPSGSDLKHAVHMGVTCDGCGASPIVGARYKCSHAKCPDYDLCESCEEKGVHDATHVLLKIRAPRTREQKQAAELQQTIAAMVRANPWLAGQIEAVEVRTEAPTASSDDPTIVHTPLSGKVNVDAVLASVMPHVVAKSNALKEKQAKEAAAKKTDAKKADVKAAPKPKAEAPKAAVKTDAKVADAKAPAAGAVKPNAARQDRELASLREMGFTHDQMMLRALLVEARARTKSQRKKLGNVAYVAAKLTNN